MYSRMVGQTPFTFWQFRGELRYQDITPRPRQLTQRAVLSEVGVSMLNRPRTLHWGQVHCSEDISCHLSRSEFFCFRG